MKLYILCDKHLLNSLNISIDSCVKKAIEKRASIIQYRNKSGSRDEIKTDLINIRKVWSGKLIINDYIEFIELADGLHIGQEDLLKFNSDSEKAILEIRKTIGRKILGLSTHNRDEILKANSLDLDYIGLGAYRGTSTKTDAEVLGENADEVAKLSKHPVGIIGGVKLTDSFKNIEYLVIGSGLYE